MKFLSDFLKFKKKQIPDTFYTISLYKHIDSNLNDDVEEVSVVKEDNKFVVKVRYINQSTFVVTLRVNRDNECDYIRPSFIHSTGRQSLSILSPNLHEAIENEKALRIIREFIEDNGVCSADSDDREADRLDREADEEDDEDEDDD